MGIIQRLKAGASRLFGKQVQPVTPPKVEAKPATLPVRKVYSNPRYRRSTTATRRFDTDTNRRYLHVSVRVTEDTQQMVAFFGIGVWNRMRKGSGDTYYRGNANRGV